MHSDRFLWKLAFRSAPWALVFGCTGGDDTASADSGGGADSADSGDSGTPEAGYACPAGMSLAESDTEHFCVDSYEALEEDGGVSSRAGVIPSTFVSFDSAVLDCAATAAVNADGATYAQKHLVTSDEWEDIADGTVGPGGFAYPFGDAYDDAICATLKADGTEVYSELQPTGSFPGCISAFGAYDLLGNAWEWADPSFFVDITGALAAFAGIGIVMDDTLHLSAGEISRLRVDGLGIVTTTVEADVDGRLYLSEAPSAVVSEDTAIKGYLQLSPPTNEPTYMIPVLVAQEGEQWFVSIMPEEDGAPIPDKRGCAYYTGTGEFCTNANSLLLHTHDFEGTIGFRCAVDAYYRE